MTEKPTFASPVASNIEDVRAWLREMSNRDLRDFGTAI